MTLRAPQDPWVGSELQLVNVDDQESLAHDISAEAAVASHEAMAHSGEIMAAETPATEDVVSEAAHGTAASAGRPSQAGMSQAEEARWNSSGAGVAGEDVEEQGVPDQTHQPVLGEQAVLSDSEDHIPATDRTNPMSPSSTASGPGAATAPLHTEPPGEARIVRVGSLVRTSTINREPLEVLAARAELEVAASRSTTPLMGLGGVVTSAKVTVSRGGDKEATDSDVEKGKTSGVDEEVVEKGRGTGVDEEESECLLLTPSKSHRTQESGFSDRTLTPEQVWPRLRCPACSCSRHNMYLCVYIHI